MADSSLKLPPDMLTYLEGVPVESSQFEFFIGKWDCETVRYNPYDGTVESQYKGLWIAQYLHDKRVVFDRFIRYAPDGREAGVGVQVRTYSSENCQWEMTQIDAHQPRTFSPFIAKWENGEMKLHADCDGWTFRGRFYDIGETSWKWEGEAGNGTKFAKTIEVVAVRASSEGPSIGI